MPSCPSACSARVRPGWIRTQVSRLFVDYLGSCTLKSLRWCRLLLATLLLPSLRGGLRTHGDDGFSAVSADHFIPPLFYQRVRYRAINSGLVVVVVRLAGSPRAPPCAQPPLGSAWEHGQPGNGLG